MNPITLSLVVACLLLGAGASMISPLLSLPFVLAAVIIGLSLKMANTWEKLVILRAGKLLAVKGPGLFAILPIVDSVVAVIDERIQTTAFNAEQALTRDTVPVNVDAIIFWHVHDARSAALEITDYRQAIDRAALQDAMSRQAQAEHEKQARVILGSAEAEIAGKFVEAAEVYANHPSALQLRAMNIIYETTKERGTTILIPSSMVDSLNPVVALALTGQAPANATDKAVA